MKAVVIMRMKTGYLIVEREVGSLSISEIQEGTVVGDDSYSTRDKIGRIASDILNPPPSEKED